MEKMKKIIGILLLCGILNACNAKDTITEKRYNTIPPKIEGYIIVEIIDFSCITQLQPKKTRKECTTYAYVRKENE